MGVNSLPKTVTRQRRGCDLNPGPSAPESSSLTTRLSSHPVVCTGLNESAAARRVFFSGASKMAEVIGGVSEQEIQDFQPSLR